MDQTTKNNHFNKNIISITKKKKNKLNNTYMPTHPFNLKFMV